MQVIAGISLSANALPFVADITCVHPLARKRGPSWSLGPRFRGCNPIPIPRLPATGAKNRGRVMAPLAVSGRVCDPAAVKLALKVPISKPKNARRGLDYIPFRGDDEGG